MNHKVRKGIISLLLLVITASIIVTDVYAQMPDTTPRMPDTTPQMPRDLFNQVFGALVKLPSTLFRMPDTTPRMPDTTPQMPDTTPRMPDWLSNFFSTIRNFLAPSSSSNVATTATKTSTPATKPKGTPQVGPYTYKPEGEAAKAGVPSFTVNAPSGWSSLGVSGTQLARFESEEIDTEEVEGGKVTTNAVIIVRATGDYESLDDFYSQYKASGKSVAGYQLLSSSNNRLEFKFKTKVDGQEITLHELDYLFFKDGISFLVKGYAADSSWSKNVGQIQSALNSFKFR